MATVTEQFTPILTAGVTGTVLNGHIESLADYKAKGGYDAIKRVLSEMTPEQVIETVKEANVRGRGGAGFPAGTKWGFIPRNREKPHYVCVNADESEPGTVSNRPVLEQRPHLLLEGFIRVETGVLFGRDRFVAAHQVAGVSDDKVMLNVNADELAKRD